MSEAIVLFEVAGVTLERRVGRGPTISDVELGRLLGYDRERNLRALVERRIDDFPGILRRRTFRQLENAGNLPEFYTVEEYSLSIVDALRLVERSEAPNRADVLAKLSDVVEKLIERASTPSMTHEDVALLASRVAAETTRAMLAAASKSRRGARVLPGQADLFAALPPASTPVTERVLAAVALGQHRSINAIHRAVRARVVVAKGSRW